MTDFSQFKTCKKHGFSVRNTPNDADIVRTFSVWKIPTFTVQEPFCRSSQMSFLPLLFQRRFLARFLTESLGGVSHSDGHLVVKYITAFIPLMKFGKFILKKAQQKSRYTKMMYRPSEKG